jgi:hypothetical protein
MIFATEGESQWYASMQPNNGYVLLYRALVHIMCGVPSQVSTGQPIICLYALYGYLEIDKTSHLQGIEFVADRVDRIQS